ncbi:MAG: DUF1499 domain-containing protein [Pseudomonadota bacterium]
MREFVNFETLKRPAKPNTALIAPDGLCKSATPDRTSPDFNVSPSALFEKVVALVQSTPDWKKVQVDAVGKRVRFVAVTKLMRFKDDVDIAVLEAPGGATIAAYSRSRLGYSDLGANARRLDALVEALL